MKRSENRILTTHSGSLIRPAELGSLDAARQEGGNGAEEAYETALRKAVGEVVKKQAEVGLDVVDDGEFSKSSWGTYINQRVSGFKHDAERDMAINYTGRDSDRFGEFFESEAGGGSRRRWRGADVCVEPIVYTDTHSMKRDIENMKSALGAVDVEEGFLPVVAPASAAFNGVNDYYKTDEEYVYTLSEALRNEYLAIYESGLVVQVDDAVLANAYDDLMAKGPEVYRKWADVRIEALNHALRGIPEDRVRYHVCFGSWHVPHVADAPLSGIIEHVLRVNAGAYSIEAANVRHEHEWEVWESTRLPEGKVLIPGVVTHHTMSVEHPDLVAQRLVRFAGLVGRENVIGGTDCGFAQSQSVRRVHPSVMWAKLASLVEGARIASQKLWAK